MSNDPKDTTVNWPTNASSPPVPPPSSSQPSNANPLITSCTEGTNLNLIGHEIFTANDPSKNK